MSEFSPDAAVRAQLAEQAQAVTGNPAGAGAIDVSQAKATVVDAENLLARLQELEARAAAAEAAANPPPPEPDFSLHADSNAPGWLHDVVGRIEARLSALEGKSGA